MSGSNRLKEFIEMRDHVLQKPGQKKQPARQAAFSATDKFLHNVAGHFAKSIRRRVQSGKAVITGAVPSTEETAFPFTDPLLEKARLAQAMDRYQHVNDTLQQSEPVKEYVEAMWPKLQRTMVTLYLGGCTDPKVPKPRDNCYRLYISEKEDMKRVEMEMEEARKIALQLIESGEAKLPDGEEFPTINVVRLPPQSEWSNIPFDEHGLLYVPHPYIVPGVRYNELYNWDAAFIARALTDDGKLDEARGLIDDLLYEVEHYGTVLCGNRTYYLRSDKSRSQPPLVTEKIVEIFDRWDELRHAGGESKTQWLERAAQRAEKYYEHWITAPHLHEESGLSRYSSNSIRPADEVRFGEHGHYEGALKNLKAMYEKQQKIGSVPVEQLDYQDRKDRYYIEQYLTVSEGGGEKQFELSPVFYAGDSAMRESGFDPSGRFGFYNVDIINHLPICLNAERLKMENEMAEIYGRLLKAAPGSEKKPLWEAHKKEWENKARATKTQINSWLWDDGIENGKQVRAPCYRDRNVNEALCKNYNIPVFRDYDFATALFMLWAGAASQKQADQVIAHIIPKLKTEFGLNTSGRETGCQWDKPLMWAPLQVVAVQALERYGHYDEALDLACCFLSTVSGDFKRTGKLFEKYSSKDGSSNMSYYTDKGYAENDEGFGWTNASVIELRTAVKRLHKKALDHDMTAQKCDFSGTGQGTLSVPKNGQIFPQY